MKVRKEYIGSLVRITTDMLSGLPDEERALWFQYFNEVKDKIKYKPRRGRDRW